MHLCPLRVYTQPYRSPDYVLVVPAVAREDAANTASVPTHLVLLAGQTRPTQRMARGGYRRGKGEVRIREGRMWNTGGRVSGWGRGACVCDVSSMGHHTIAQSLVRIHPVHRVHTIARVEHAERGPFATHWLLRVEHAEVYSQRIGYLQLAPPLPKTIPCRPEADSLRPHPPKARTQRTHRTQRTQRCCDYGRPAVNTACTATEPVSCTQSKTLAKPPGEHFKPSKQPTHKVQARAFIRLSP